MKLKRLTAAVLALIVSAGFLPTVCPETQAQTVGFRAVWVATVINLDYPSGQGLSVAALKREADSILSNAQDMGFNAVILQVRPAGDAFYPSKYFPWSEYITGEQGKAPEGGFDPLAYFVEGAHSRGMELHAWVNPFRAARNAADAGALSADHPAKLNSSWTKTHTDGHLYFDPGNPDVRKLVVDGVREIVENYEVDGIHFDDYFYPGKDFSDSETFQKYGSGFTNRDDWRRDNINKLIRETGEAVHNARPGCRFGVAPQAIWANKTRNSLGSDTKGYETYYEQFADSRTWVLKEWVDYIAPQIYWEIGREGSDYAKVLAWWAELVKNTSVDLYVGHATYLMNGNSSRPAWSGTGEIARQLAENEKYTAVKGDIHFRYALIAGDAKIAASVKAMYTEPAQPVAAQQTDLSMPAPSIGTLTVGRPDKNVTYSGSNYYFAGASDPRQKLTVNGKEIKNRTPQGYFSYYATLKKGENTFTFAQGNTKVTRVITVPGGTTPAAAPPKMSEATIEPGVFPEVYDEIHAPGSTVTLSCTAPIGASVIVRIGGQRLTMTPSTTKKPSDGGIYSTTFKAAYTYPDTVTGNDSPVITIGTPVYTMTMDGITVSRTATASFKMSTPSARLVAEVVTPSAFVYPKASTTGGPSGELSYGQTDAVVTQKSGTWVELASGLWVLRSDVRLTVLDTKLTGHVTGASYQSGDKWDTLSVLSSYPTATSIVWNGKTLTFTVFSSDAAPAVKLPADALFGSVTSSANGGKAVYTLTPAAGAVIEGFYAEPFQGGLRLFIKRRPVAKAGSKPLSGMTFVLDAGHGGSAYGAYGMLGEQYAEKTIVLYAAHKLKKALSDLGAQVVMTRSGDVYVELEERLGLSREQKPDLFISLHCNSMNEDVNSDDIRGVSVFYREAASAAFAESLYDDLKAAQGFGGKGFHQSNLYVCRGFWTPSVIVETAFINNPFDFEWLVNDSEQAKFINAMAQSIVNYFR